MSDNTENKNKFVKYVGKVNNTSEYKKGLNTVKLTVDFVVDNIQGTFNITDIMLQGSNKATGYTINTKEMIEPSEGKPKHYNILVRGDNNGIIINNDGSASSGLNFDIYSSRGTTGPINIETLHKTRHLTINEIVAPNTKLSADSFAYTLNNNGVENRNYKGSFLGIPSGFGLYNIDMYKREGANFVFMIKEYEKKDKY